MQEPHLTSSGHWAPGPSESSSLLHIVDRGDLTTLERQAHDRPGLEQVEHLVLERQIVLEEQMVLEEQLVV